VSAPAGTVLPRRPGIPAFPRMPSGLAVSRPLARCRRGHGFSLRQGALTPPGGLTSLFPVWYQVKDR